MPRRICLAGTSSGIRNDDLICVIHNSLLKFLLIFVTGNVEKQLMILLLRHRLLPPTLTLCLSESRSGPPVVIALKIIDNLQLYIRKF